MRGEREGHTLQTTALVNEAYLRLVGIDGLRWRDRAHFFAMAATLMRRVLVDHARQRGREKRGAGISVVSLDENAVAPSPEVDVVALDEALERLAAGSAAEPGRRAPVLRRPVRGGDRRSARHLAGDGEAGLGHREAVALQRADGRMTTLDDWPRVKRVLAEALEREGGERRSYLDEACGSDAQLRARIERCWRRAKRHVPGSADGVLLEPEVLEDLSGLVVESVQLLAACSPEPRCRRCESPGGRFHRSAIRGRSPASASRWTP